MFARKTGIQGSKPGPAVGTQLALVGICRNHSNLSKLKFDFVVRGLSFLTLESRKQTLLTGRYANISVEVNATT